MEFHQPGAKFISCSAPFVFASIVLAISVRGDEASEVAAPPPTFVTSYRMLVHSPRPASSLIDESVAFSPDGTAVASGRVEVTHDPSGKPVSSATVVSICNPNDGTVTGRIELAASDGCSVAYSPDGLTLAIGLAQEVKLYDVPTHKERTSVSADRRGCFDRLTFTADGRRLAAASYDSVIVWDLATSQLVATMRVGAGLVHGFAFSPDGLALATAAEGPSAGGPDISQGGSALTTGAIGGQIRLWKLDEARTVSSFDYRQPAYDVVFAPDGRTLATAAGDGARLWRVAAASQPRKVAASPVYCVAYSRDGRHLAMGTEEISFTQAPGEVRLWDTRIGYDRLVLQAPMSRVRSVAFAPDGRSVVAATREGVFVWELPIPSPGRAATAGSPESEADTGDLATLRRLSTAKPSIRTTQSAIDSVLLGLLGIIVLAAPVFLFRWWRSAVLVYRARERCRWLLEDWLERDGFSLIRCRMIFPLCYLVTVEDSQGREFKGWAEISGKIWSTPEYVPLRVEYFLMRPGARNTKQPLSPERIALWDEWLDRQSQD